MMNCKCGVPLLDEQTRCVQCNRLALARAAMRYIYSDKETQKKITEQWKGGVRPGDEKV